MGLRFGAHVQTFVKRVPGALLERVLRWQASLRGLDRGRGCRRPRPLRQRPLLRLRRLRLLLKRLILVRVAD
jgi:hypothetical protein